MEPYADDPQNSGTGKGREWIIKVLEPEVKSGKQAVFHAIGDRAVKEFLDAVEELTQVYPYIPELRLRIEHAQIIRPEDISRIRDLGILVAAQPIALSNPEKDRALLGEKRLDFAYPYRALLNAGVELSFGTDAPAEDSVAPLISLSYAVDRENGLAIGAEEALRCYTVNSAYAEKKEDHKGTIKSRYLADVTVLSNNPLDVPPDRIKDIQVEMTIVGGNIVYER